MTAISAQILDIGLSNAGGFAAGGTEADPVKVLLELRLEEQCARAQVTQLQQLLLIRQHRANPELQKAVETLRQGESDEQESNRRPVLMDEFLNSSPPTPVSPSTQKTESLADRSKWSPKLRKLIEEKFPEEGKAERVRRARAARRAYKLGQGLSLEEVRYYAEDVDLEYDV